MKRLQQPGAAKDEPAKALGRSASGSEEKQHQEVRGKRLGSPDEKKPYLLPPAVPAMHCWLGCALYANGYCAGCASAQVMQSLKDFTNLPPAQPFLPSAQPII